MKPIFSPASNSFYKASLFVVGTLAVGNNLAGCTSSSAAPVIYESSDQSPETTETRGVSEDTVRVGILHSLTGTMAISEVSVKNADLLAIKEINDAGGVLGKKIVPVIEDGASDPATFTLKAEKLLTRDNVSTIFGCWTSSSRKAVLPVVEQMKGLLYYPIQYEGREASPNIFYTGATTNQQIVPAVEWLLSKGKKRMFLLGSDYIFPRTANKVIKAQLKGSGGILAGEEYFPLGSKDFAALVAKLKVVKPSIVFSTLNGDSNVAFFKELKRAGLTAKSMPVMSVSVAEEEIKAIGVPNIVGQFAAWNYFETTKSATNDLFVRNYKKVYKNAVTSDPVDAAYSSIYLWRACVEKAKSFDVDAIRKAAPGVAFDGPGGHYRIDGDNQHIYKKVRIGQIQPNGMFKELWSTPNYVKPDPYLKSYSWAAAL